jgi:hypothetical protein
MTNDATDSIARLLDTSKSASFRRLNAHLLLPHSNPRPATQLKPAAKKRIPRQRPPQKTDPGRHLVLIESIRGTLLDEDNLIPKWHIDALRYAGILHSDAPGACHIRTTQRKALPGEPEHVVITIELIA